MKAGGEEGDRGISCLDGITNSTDVSLSKFQEIVKDRETWRAIVYVIRVGYERATEQ